ncbi:RmlC-like cupin domain-containing protein [Trichoderma novae-zelandiae]
MAVNVASSGSALDNLGDVAHGQDRFEELVRELKDILGPSSGLTSADIDVETLMNRMRAYDSRDMQWSRYALGDASRGYTRNLVDEGNGKSNLLVLVWSPGKGSPIHDHGNAHCIMKILRGELTETRYEFPEKEAPKRPMTVLAEKTYRENQVTYMADELGLHQVSNRGSDFAVSLHLYTPPNVAREGCHIFDQKTGKRSHVPGCMYFSAYGRLIKQ